MLLWNMASIEYLFVLFSIDVTLNCATRNVCKSLTEVGPFPRSALAVADQSMNDVAEDQGRQYQTRSPWRKVTAPATPQTHLDPSRACNWEHLCNPKSHK
ncbi:hypothetical protein PS15m_008960 [Mucor circinelloides]